MRHTEPLPVFPRKSWVVLAVGAALSISPAMTHADDPKAFRRIASFPAFENYDIDTESVAEIVAASSDGMTLMYTDSENGSLGFVDITDPANPAALGAVPVGGQPTSVAAAGGYALVAVNTSPDFVDPSGHLAVVEIATRAIVAIHDLGGQPDSVAVSADGRYAAIAIENERNEEWCVVPGDGLANDFPVPEDDAAAAAACHTAGGEVGGLPQSPGGALAVVDLVGKPGAWGVRSVDLANLDGMPFASDPEPEYVDINRNDIAVVTLQENNHIALVDLASGAVVNHFSAGTTDLHQVDTQDNKLIELTGSLSNVPREPDGVTWIADDRFVTANEGDLHGGSRGFTIFDTDGEVAYEAGNSVEHAIVRHGHFPDARADDQGNEPENVEFARFGEDDYLFVASERASVVLVYNTRGKSGKAPKLKQVLATMVRPEGLLALPQRGLFVAACEEDDRDAVIRAGLTIFRLSAEANYPTIVSKDRADGTPIPWSALSGLAVDTENEDTVYTVQDSFYEESRILVMDVEDAPAKVKGEIVLRDMHGKIPAMPRAVVNDDLTVNLDPEGIATRAAGGFWIVSEGAGTAGDLGRPSETLNLLLKVGDSGGVQDVVTLPDAVNDRQVRFGYEGVAAVGRGDGEVVYVAFQREWLGDPDDRVRIGRYDTHSGEWTFFYYPIEAPLSANGGWVGLSDLAYLGGDRFAVVERDNQGGPDAVIKRLYAFSVAGLTPLPDDGSNPPAFPVVAKTLVRDLVPDLQATGGLVPEKIEGLAVNADGDALVVNDNDGVDDSNGETQLLLLEGSFDGD